MVKKSVYLDNAAATKMDDQVKKVMDPYFSTKYFNPSATYLSAKEVAKDIEKARAEIAFWLGCKPTEFIFTAGGTEANNLAISGVMSNFPEGNLIVSLIEHDSVFKLAEKYEHKVAPVNNDGLIDLTKLEKLIDDKTVLVSIMYANNEIGTVQSIKQISKIIEKIRKSRKSNEIKYPIYLHIDASQAPSYLDLHVASLGIDLMTLNSGKIYGPKQFGGLYVNRSIELIPLIIGGGQENGLRSGTESPANILGFSEALKLAQTNRKSEVKRLQELQLFLVKELNNKIPGIVINGSLKQRLPNNLHITIPGKDNEQLMMKLDEEGIQCATGSACSASSSETSNTLKALGLSEEAARSSLRFSMGKYTTKNDLIYLIKILEKISQ